MLAHPYDNYNDPETRTYTSQPIGGILVSRLQSLAELARISVVDRICPSSGFFMAWSDGLTLGTSAHKIASGINNRVHVVAGSVIRKSSTMKRRVGRLLEGGVDPSQILPVTFTRVAAEDLHRELVGMGGRVQRVGRNDFASALFDQDHMRDMCCSWARLLICKSST